MCVCECVCMCVCVCLEIDTFHVLLQNLHKLCMSIYKNSTPLCGRHLINSQIMSVM